MPKGRGLIRTPGIADLKVVKTTLLKYEKGEIAHIENVLLGEKKIREFNITNRKEESTLTEEETITENEKETQTTDRFELEKELSSVIKEDMKFDTGVKVSAKLGPVQLDTHLDFAYNKSKEESNKTATKTAQETMNRALSKYSERKKTQRTVTTIITTEDKNSHSFDNEKGKDHIHGLYYWVDKYYLAKVINYGKRLMFEFIVPEPAAFYIFSKTHKPLGEDAKIKPELPSIKKLLFVGGFPMIKDMPIISFKEITIDNYAQLAAKYNAQDVAVPPKTSTIITTSFNHNKPSTGEHDSQEDQDDNGFAIFNKELKVPDGYVAKVATMAFSYVIKREGSGQDRREISEIDILIGQHHRFNAPAVYKQDLTYIPSFNLSRPTNTMDFLSPLKVYLNGEDDILPVSIRGLSRQFSATVEVICELTPRKFEEWQKSTFNSIMTAYYNQLSEYENWLRAQEINAGVTIEGNNPDLNRRVEKEELKKHCIEMFTGQRFDKFDAMRSHTKPWGYPEFSINESFEEGKYIQFFEQAFEWEQITYVFYPYFWGRKPNWAMIKSFNDPDPVFTSFLQAGAARVLVPARPGFERSVLYYYNRGKIWQGSNPPIPGGKLWVSLVDEIKEQQGQFEGGEQEGEPWTYKVPTSLVYLDSMTKPLTTPIYDLSANYPDDVKAAEKAKTSADFS